MDLNESSLSFHDFDAFRSATDESFKVSLLFS
jgi:hypothetical protein